MSSIDLNELSFLTRPVEENDSMQNKYLFLAYRKKLYNYRILSASTMVSSRMFESLLNTSFLSFVKRNSSVLVMANLVEGNISSLFFRGIEKKDNTVLSNGPMLPYGICSLNPDRKFSDPIVICEGIADCDFLRTMYPDCIAMTGARLSSFSFNIVTRLSSHIILCNDNDQAGNEAFEAMSFKFKKEGKIVSRLEIPAGMKDAGDILELSFKGRKQEFKDMFEMINESLVYSSCGKIKFSSVENSGLL